MKPLVDLESLDIYGDNIKDIKFNIGKLINLTFLDIRGVKISTLPNSIIQLSKLENILEISSLEYKNN